MDLFFDKIQNIEKQIYFSGRKYYLPIFIFFNAEKNQRCVLFVVPREF